MSNVDTFQVGDMTPEEFEAARAQYDGQRSAQNTGMRAHVMPVQRTEITLNGAGQVASSTVVNKSRGGRSGAVYAGPKSRPGFVNVAGMDTSIEDAIAGGLLPLTYKEGDPLPNGFNGQTEALASPLASDDATDANEVDQREAKEALSSAEQQVSKAGEVLDGVDQAYGSGVTDTLLADAATAGEYDVDNLPDGVTPKMAEQVMTGYIAQANNTLAGVGSSVTALEEVLSDHELRAARLAVLGKNVESLQDLGRIAASRLSSLPTSNPDAFQALLADMDPADRKCIKQNRTTGEWTVNVPNEAEISFGAAILTGKLTF